MADNTQLECARCHAKVTEKSAYCPKCGLRITIDNTEAKPAVSEYADSSQPEINSHSFGVSTLLLTTTLIAVCLALFAAAPGLGIMLAIISLPAFLRTLMVVQRRKSQGHEVPPLAKIGLYLGSFGVTLVVTVVTLSASTLAFCLTCLGAYSAVGGQSRQSGQMAMNIAIAFTLVIAGLLIWLFSKWIRARWKRDTATDNKF